MLIRPAEPSSSPITTGERSRTADRVALLIVVVSLLLLAVASYGAWHVKRLQDRSEEMLSQNVDSIRTAVELELHIQELRHQLDLYLWRHSLDELEQPKFTDLKAFKSERANIDVWLHRAEDSAHTRNETKLILQVHDGLGKFYAQLERLAATTATEAEKVALAEEAEAILEKEVLPPAREYLSADEALLELNREKAALQSHRLAKLLLFLGVFGSVAALVAGYVTARAIHRSLVQLHIPIRDVAGKLSEVAGEVVVSTKLDLDDLGPALQRVSQEVTEVVEQLHARHRDIVRADQLVGVGQLAAGLAHEIRNPLMAMKMLVQTAKAQDSGTLDRRDLHIIDEEIRRLEELLTEFLEFARPTPLKQSITDLRNVVESTVDFVQRQADARQVTLHCEMPSEPLMLRIDAPRIRQVVLNLLLNGIQAAPCGGNVRVSIEMAPVKGRSMCRLKVADDGPGIGPRQATRIFEPFYSTKETGLGLGLVVSQRICRSHGGDLGLERGDYSGAILVVELPLPSGDEPASMTATSPDESKPSEQS